MVILRNPWFRFASLSIVLMVAVVLGTPRQVKMSVIGTQAVASPAIATPEIAVTDTPADVSTATAVVTKREDTDDGQCDPSDCSLREAVESLTNGGTITFDDNVEGTIYLEDQIAIKSAIEIKGKLPKSDLITIQAKYGIGILRIEPRASLIMSLITIAGSPNFENSGGIYVDNGTLIVINCTFRDNGLSAITSFQGNIDVTGSTFYRNEATQGGAIDNRRGITHIRNSTFYNNKAAIGGAIANSGIMIVQYSTFSQNSASTSHTIDNQKELTVGNSILDGPVHNGGFTKNCEGKPFNDDGHNIQFPYDQCGTTIPIYDPLLSLGLADNGGPTQTIALLDNSMALDAGDFQICSSTINLIDQRGFSRVAYKCDIGAFEK